MTIKKCRFRYVLPALLLILSALACALNPSRDEVAVTSTVEAPGLHAGPTPTFTLIPLSVEDTPDTPSLCDGLGGEIELSVLVGPADAVGLEPLAVGRIPFVVAGDGDAQIVQGGSNISYADILVKEWGTYEVNMSMEASISGECIEGVDGAQLNLTVSMVGDQLVVVNSAGFQGEYPWAGTVSLDLSLPVVDGATAEGEGWSFVLYLSD